MLGPQGDGSQGLDGRWHDVDGGLPSYSGRQKQSGEPFTIRQPEFGPHGFGSHLSPSGTENSNRQQLKHTTYTLIFIQPMFVF